jgi:hypothetical protein
MSEPAGEVPSTLIEAVEELASAFDRFEIRYALIGALAAGYRSRPRSTRDVDFLLSIPSLKLPPLLDDLRSKGFDFDLAVAIREWTQEHMLVMSFRGVRIDWLKPPIPAYSHVLDRATDEPWLNRAIRIASAEGLILLKLLAFRPQDQVDIENIVLSNRATLDLDWIRTEWKSIASLDDPRMKRLMEWAASS